MVSERLFNFTNIFKQYKEYLYTKDELKELVLTDYASRNNPAKIQIGPKIIDATIGRVLINLLIMKPFVEKDVVLTEEFLFGYDSVTEGNLNEYFNFILDKNKEVADFDNLRQTVAETINEMSDISGELNVLAGNSLSFHDFVRLFVEDPEAKEIFNYKLEDSLQFNEIEDRFDALGHKIEKFFIDRPDTELHAFMKADTGINRKQLTQAIAFIGLKPDIDGSIIPVAINANYTNGLGTLQNYFINSKGTRKALITNSKQVRKSGYLTRKLSLALIDRYHDHTLEDCGTTHFVEYNIDSAKKLFQIQGRHYYDIDADKNIVSELKTVSHSVDTDLIGKTIGLRSPVTCAGDKVCRTCYGSELSEINKDLNTGIVAVLLITMPLTQKLLSAKHLLTTNAEVINWDYGGKKAFFDYFSINMNSIFFRDPDTTVVIHKIPYDKRDEDEIGDYAEEIDVLYQNKKVFSYKTPEGIKLYYNFKNNSKSTEDEVIIDEPTLKLKGMNFDDGDPVFTFMAKNNELTKSLQQILDLIESSGHLGVTTYNELVNKFNDLLIENGLDVASVHAELISSVLIRDKETHAKLDFSKEKLDKYEIHRVSKVVLNSALSKSLAFERLSEQFVNLHTYDKVEESLMDFLFH